MNTLGNGNRPGAKRIGSANVAHPASSVQRWGPVLEYVVMRQEGHWWIRYDGKRYGGTRVFAESLREAVESALEAGIQGYDARVFVEYGDGYQRPVWSYGEIPCPLGGLTGVRRRRRGGAPPLSAGGCMARWRRSAVPRRCQVDGNLTGGVE
jgi:hypothetical protein